MMDGCKCEGYTIQKMRKCLECKFIHHNAKYAQTAMKSLSHMTTIFMWIGNRVKSIIQLSTYWLQLAILYLTISPWKLGEENCHST